MNPLLTLAIVLLAGVWSGTLARRIGLPGVTGQVLAGVALGPAGLALFAQGSSDMLRPLTHFALGLMAATVGTHLNVRRLRNAGRRLGLLFALEATLIPALVFIGLTALPGVRWSTALLFGAIAISTAPATVVAIVRETRAKGVLVKTLLPGVALNNLSCIVLFELARAAAHLDRVRGVDNQAELLLEPLRELALAAGFGVAVAVGVWLLDRVVSHAQVRATAGFAAILLTAGVAIELKLSPLLVCLFLGLAQGNLTRERHKLVDGVFRNFEPAILAIFFTLAGMELTLEHVGRAGLLASMFFVLRSLGKLGAGALSMRLAGATRNVRRYLGMALFPQAGVAVGLVLLLDEDQGLKSAAPELGPMFLSVVLTAVVVNEIVGPVLTRLALNRAGESGADRDRLLDFIQEENITIGLDARNMEEAIKKLSGLLVNSHHLDPALREPLEQTALARERDESTCLGDGLAVPHALLPDAQLDRMVGVIGISREGLAFETPDGGAVHIVVLLGAPESANDRRLQVLAGLARALGFDPALRAALRDARSPAHAYELLHGEDTEDFNYFLEKAA